MAESIVARLRRALADYQEGKTPRVDAIRECIRCGLTPIEADWYLGKDTTS